MMSSVSSTESSTAPSSGIEPTGRPAPCTRSSRPSATRSRIRSGWSRQPTSFDRIHARTATSSSRPSTRHLASDEHLWKAVIELQTENRGDDHPDEAAYRAFSQMRQNDTRARLLAGGGAWFVALDGPDGEIAATCGVVVTDARGRFQVVDTALAYRRRGICSRLVVEAGRISAERYGARQFVIVADTNYHALGLYESLGFRRAEHVFGTYLRPGHATWLKARARRRATAARRRVRPGITHFEGERLPQGEGRFCRNCARGGPSIPLRLEHGARTIPTSGDGG